MSSEISKTLTAYRSALDQSRARYEALYTSRGRNALEFYDQYAHRLIRRFREDFSDAGRRRRLHREIRRLFGTEAIDFVAIDGSCNKDPFTDFITFSACAYGAKGRLELNDSGDKPGIRYHRWELERDVSMVAHVPVPFAQLAELVGEYEDFLMSDQERVNLATVHTKLMQLAEVYLAYNVVLSSSIERPRLVLMDLLPSSVIASIAGQPTAVKLSGYRHDRRSLTFQDIAVALAHPFQDELVLPNRNEFRLHHLILGELHKKGCSSLELGEMASQYGVELEALLRAARRPHLYGDGQRFEEIPEGILDKSASPPKLIPRASRLGLLAGTEFTAGWVAPGGEWRPLDVRASWQFTLSLFRSICDRLFRNKEPDAMVYQVEDADGSLREHWLDPNDIDFLIAVGVRALIEACWQQRVMLIGIAKDSASRYLTRNYLGVLRHALRRSALADLEVGKLPWTDRMFFEFIAQEKEDLAAPWASCEFDSAFMTLWIASRRIADGQEWLRLGAVQDHIVAHMGLFARSLGQFYLNRSKATPLMGHVVFIDRLLQPELDQSAPRLDLTSHVLEANGLGPHDLGRLEPLGYEDRDQNNPGQDIAMYLLSCLTRNHFPEVIGYPDPLHKADWGAKTLGDRLRATIRSSQVAFAARPLSKALRTIRDNYGRR